MPPPIAVTIFGPGVENHTSDDLSAVLNITFNTMSGAFTTAVFNSSQFGVAFPVIHGGQGADTLQFNMTTTSFSANSLQLQNWSSNDVVSIIGTAGSDTIGGAQNVRNAITGGGGADTLNGHFANDTFHFSGFDVSPGETVNGYDGTDSLIVLCTGAVYDFSVATLSSIEALSVATAGPHFALVTLAGNQVGAGGITTISGSAVDTLYLTISGPAVDLSRVTFSKINTPITINGTAGADSLTGSKQSDVINGDLGVDRLIGGRGKDTLTGGGDGDFFDFNHKTETPKGANRDVIQDFNGVGGELDRIDLSGIDANSHKGHDQKFTFIKAQKFHHKSGELHFVKHGTYVTVEGDINGDGKADFKIDVHNLANDLNSLVKGDFVL